MTSATSTVDGAAEDVLAEIDELTRTARATRDPALEARLVTLRHEAFEHLSRTPGRDAWPPRYPDPFPGVDGVPRMAAADLSTAVLGGALVHHGSLHVERLLDADQVAWFVEHIDRAFDGREAVAAGAEVASVAPWYVPFPLGRAKAEGFGSEHFVRNVDAPRVLNELACTFADAGVQAAVTEYLGERPAMIANKWILRRTPAGLPGTNFHQDGQFLGDGIRTVDCWIALTACGPGTGAVGLDLLPCRAPGVLSPDERADLPWTLAPEAVQEAAPDVPIVSPVFAAGDALFFDELLAHRTSRGTDLGRRYALESWFVAPSAYPPKHVPIAL